MEAPAHGERSRAGAALRAQSGTNHERYLRLFEVVENGDNQIAWAFNDLRRSVADERLAFMVRLGLVTDEELGRFSEETRERTRLILGLLR